jgi:cobalamin biosynthesis Mg chelatase CobN
VTPTFGQVCDATDAQSGMKRVAVVLDYGRAVDGDGSSSPPDVAAECAVVPTAATGAEVLAAVAAVRNGTTGLVCGINGYPATGCGGAVASLTDEQKAADTPVTLAATASASAQTQPPVGATPGATPFSPTATAGPLIAPAPGISTGSGVPVVVWVGLVILLLGVAALVWAARRGRQEV